jgi:protein involved in polysaccharide export with SLBB domain
MFKVSKMAAVLVVFALTIIGISLWAQPPDRSGPRRRARPRPERAAPEAPGTPRDDAKAVPSAAILPALPAPPITYLETGAKLFNNAQFEPASKYLEAANRYRDQLQENERPILDAYLKELSKVQQAAKVPAPSDVLVAATSSTTNASATRPERPAYVVEPPDLVIVEVLDTLSGRPISGERLVRPDGKISLGFYGEIDVAGLTIPEIKEKIVLHLRKFITDETLGLVDLDPETGEPRVDSETQKLKRIDPKETDRVFVDVTAYNSAFSYVEGKVISPGRIPYTGGDTVLDLIHYVGGLLPTADQTKIRLVRSYPKGSPARVLPVDYAQITMGTDSSTNYPILPYDRLVVPCNPSYKLDPVSARELSTRGERLRAGMLPDHLAGSIYYDRDREKSSYFGRQAVPPSEDQQRSNLEPRISGIEEKLDKLLGVVAAMEDRTTGRSGEKSTAEPGEQSPFAMDEEDASRMEPLSKQRSGSTGANPHVSPRRVRPRVVRPSPGAPPSPEATKRVPELPKLQTPAENRSPFGVVPQSDVPDGRSPFDDTEPTPPPGKPQQQDRS